MKNTTPRRTRTTSLRNRGIGNLPLSYLVVIAICGCIIAAGFLLAARQHFVSMDLGMKNSKLRKQIEDLEAEHRRLILARETALSPREITKTARSLGFIDTLDQGLTVAVPAVSSGTPSANTAVAVVKTPTKPATSPILTKTAFHRPAESLAKSDAKKPASKKPSGRG